jgi:hypothetical protein
VSFRLPELLLASKSQNYITVIIDLKFFINNLSVSQNSKTEAPIPRGFVGSNPPEETMLVTGVFRGIEGFFK